MQVKKQQLEPCMEQLTGLGLRKDYNKAIYCHLVYLIYTQSTSCEMPGWMIYKLESRLLGEISTTSDMWISQFSRSVMSDSLQPHGLQHSRLPCLSPILELVQLKPIQLVMPSNYLILCCPLLLLPPIFPSIRVFSKESVLHIRWLKILNFNFSISPSNEHSGLISFRMDWFDLLAVQGTLKGLLQHYS